MNYSILLVLKKPNGDSYGHSDDYNKCVSQLEALANQNAAVGLLGESTILLPLNQELTGVADVVCAIGDLPYTYTILTEDTKWNEITKKV